MRTTRKILLLEAAGFVALLALLWADEVLDLPHRLLGAPATPMNVREGLLESVLVILLAGVVLLLTHRLLARVHHLEGLMHVCGSCGKVRDRDGWVGMEDYLRAHSEADLRHTWCVHCILETMGYRERGAKDTP